MRVTKNCVPENSHCNGFQNANRSVAGERNVEAGVTGQLIVNSRTSSLLMTSKVFVSNVNELNKRIAVSP